MTHFEFSFKTLSIGPLEKKKQKPGCKHLVKLCSSKPLSYCLRSLIIKGPLPWSRSQAKHSAQSDQQPQWATATGGARAAPHVCLKAKINLPCAWKHNPPTWAGTAGKLHTINKHRCAIITCCLLRYRDGLYSPICQLKYITAGAQWTQVHCEACAACQGSCRHCQVCPCCGNRPYEHSKFDHLAKLIWEVSPASGFFFSGQQKHNYCD